MKKISAVDNTSNGMDLIIDDTRFLFGNTESSLSAFHALLKASEEALSKNGEDKKFGVKNIKIISNHVGGFDLHLERDSGNPKVILTGVNSKKFFKQLEKVCLKALTNLYDIQTV